MENYFLLLELSFDPPENNEEKIKAAISAKRAQWSKEKNNPQKKAAVSEYLENLDKITAVMLDPKARKDEAAKAKKIKEEKKQELKRKAELLGTKDGTLSEKDFKWLLKNFGPYGFSEDEIRSAFNTGKKKEEELDLSEILDKSKANNIQNCMRQMNMKDKTLYDFLSLNPSSSAVSLCGAAEEMKKKILAKGEKSSHENAAQELCGLCMIVFKDSAGKKKYDNYVKLTRYGSVNEAVDELARGNRKRIEPKMMETLIDIAVRDYRTGVSEASGYIRRYCIYMGYIISENKIVCGLCGAENPAGSTHCVKCKEPLFITCPSCETENSNAAKECSRCGFHLNEMGKALDILREAKNKYAEQSIEEAEKLVKQAKVYWPGHPDIISLEQTFEIERQKSAEVIAGIMQEIRDKNLYEAQSRINQAKANGYRIDDAVSGKVSSALQEVERRLMQMRSAAGDEAYRIAVELSGIIADSDELNQSMKKYPPEASPAAGHRLVGEDIILTWEESPSYGELQYRVVRKENTYPNSATDGVVLYTGRERSYTDCEPEKNKAFCYSVFTVRNGIYSCAARFEKTVVIVGKPENFKAFGGDEMITLSWEKDPEITEVRLWKYCGTARPMDDRSYEAVSCNRFDGFTISELQNGCCYWFALSVGRTINGITYFSEKEYLSAVPQKLAEPLQNFKAELFDEIFKCSWEASEWDVILFYSPKKAEYTVGTVYDLNDLLLKYRKIDISLKSPTEAEFKLNFVGECYIIPGVIHASNVILNEAAYISSVSPVKEISFDLNAAATEMYVNFTWPKRIDRSMLVYRMDDYPSGIDDPLAERIECSKRQYEANEGILISKPVRGTYYALVYAYFENDGRRIFSEPVRALMSNEPPRDVEYSFKYKKPGFFNKKCTLNITIETDGECAFPPFVIVSKFRSMPLKRGDGEILLSVEQSTEIKGSRTLEFNIEPIRSDTKLKLFFMNDKNYKLFRVACKAGNTI